MPTEGNPSDVEMREVGLEDPLPLLRRKRRDSSIENRKEIAEQLDYYTHVIFESIIQYQVI